MKMKRYLPLLLAAGAAHAYPSHPPPDAHIAIKCVKFIDDLPFSYFWEIETHIMT